MDFKIESGGIKSGKMFQMFSEFIFQIKSGTKTMCFVPEYVVMSNEEYLKLSRNSQQQGNPKNSGKKEESASPGGGVQQTHVSISQLVEDFDNKIKPDRVESRILAHFAMWAEKQKHA